jgi:flagellar hook-length control protein FliK
MEIAPLPAPVSSPAPAAGREPPRQRDDDAPSFAERLDEQAAARRAKQAARPEKKTAATDPSPATPEAPADDTAVVADNSGKSANPGIRLADSADALAGEKVADEAVADPTAVIAQMLQSLSAPPQAAPTAPKPPAGGVEAAAGPDPREVMASAAKEGAEAAAKADGSDTARPPADTAAATPEAPPAPAPTADNSLLAAAGTGTPTVTPPPASPTHEAAAPRAAPVPLTPQALGLSIAKHAAAGEKVFEISLTPDDLGRIDVRLEFADDGRLTAHVFADRPETLHLLERDRGELARALGGQGLPADGSSLNFALRDDRAGSNAGDGSGRRGRNRAGATPDPESTAKLTSAVDLEV